MRILMQEKKTQLFLSKYSTITAVFSIETLMEEIELLVAQNQEFEYRTNKKRRTFFGKN